MKILKFLGMALIILAVLYLGAIYAGFNLPKPAVLDNGIEGNAELKVTLLMDNNTKSPLPNIEVDVAPKPGPPPKGGVAVTDGQGVASFKIKPGDYFVFFNDLTFPKNLSTPAPQPITVVEGSVSETTLLITTSK